MDDIIRCYADVMYLGTTLRLPPQPIAADAEQGPAPSARPGLLRDMLRRGAILVARLAAAPAPAILGRRGLRRTGA